MSEQCHSHSHKRDYLFLTSLTTIIIFYSLSYVNVNGATLIFSESVRELAHRMWWGVLIGIAFVGFLNNVPRNLVMQVIGKGGTVKGIFKATAAGVLLDLCSHGILLVGMKLYERGASLGQVMAFLIASPWNSFSLTFILFSLIGIKWTLIFISLSIVIAIISGITFDILVKKGILPSNPNRLNENEPQSSFTSFLKTISFNPIGIITTLKYGFKESRMILRWVLFGIILASLLRAFVPLESFQTLFAPTMAGLGLTLFTATIIEVCSEGSTPIAADIFQRANAPGNSFGFLMTGVSTDYTEIMGLKETTKSWKVALFLPLITLPQIIILAIILNG